MLLEETMNSLRENVLKNCEKQSIELKIRGLLLETRPNNKLSFDSEKEKFREILENLDKLEIIENEIEEKSLKDLKYLKNKIIKKLEMIK